MPRLAVSIPTFDRRDMLAELLDALLRQERSDEIQIVVSDNASTDGTEELCRALAQRHPQIKYVRAPENRGPDRNFLASVEHADAEYCWLFGSDDAPRPGALARVLELLDGGVGASAGAAGRAPPAAAAEAATPTHTPDILLFDRVWCDLAMQPTRVDHFLALGGPRTFDTAVEAQMLDYLGAATGLCGLLSYLSSVVVKRDRWQGAPAFEEYIGSAYVHTAKLLSVFAGGAVVRYVPEPLVLCRGDNEGLMEHGLFNRARIDFVWYGRMIDELLPGAPARAAAHRAVRREFTPARLLLLLADARGEEPRELLGHMRAFGYGGLQRTLVGVPARVPPLRRVLRVCLPPAKRLWWARSRRATARALAAG